MALRRLLLPPFVLAALLAFAAACDDAGDGDADDAAVAQETVFIELRVWQHVGDAEDLWVSARPEGGQWDALGTVPFPLDGVAEGYGPLSHYRYRNLAIAGVGLRVWQPVADPAGIYVQACAKACRELTHDDWPWPWRPLGMNLLLLDGHSPGYRYGDLTVAVPRGNPELLAERERLLALRDVLEGGGTELDWSVGTPTASWEGVTVSGSPSRVTALELSDRGLKGEIWGYLGDFAELTELRLDGNALTGTIPSAMSVLSKLTDVYLGGNALSGCIPPPLLRTANHDLDTLGLPACPPPGFRADMRHDPGAIVTSGSYRMGLLGRGGRVAVFDVPDGASLLVFGFSAGMSVNLRADHRFESIFDNPNLSGIVFRDPTDVDAVWLYLDGGGGWEWERSLYSGCVYDCGAGGSAAALIEQVAASVWAHAIESDDGTWVWP